MKKQDPFDSATETILRARTLAVAGAIFRLSPTPCATR